MADGASEMTNLLTKTFQSRFGRQRDEVVSDRKNRPVCLDAFPRSHKHLAETQMLFDVLVKGLDGKTLHVNLDHLGFAHLQVVGDKETIRAAHSGNEKFDLSDSGQPDELRSDFEILLCGNPDPGISHPSLGQKRHGYFDPVQENISILFESGYENSTRLLNRIENGSAAVPGVHDHRKSPRKQKKCFPENFQSQGHFAFESSRSADFFGFVSSKGKDLTQGSSFQNRCHRTQTLGQSLSGVMKSQALNIFSFSGSQSIVENQKSILAILENDLAAFGNRLCESCRDLRGIFYKMVKTIGIAFAEVIGNFLDRTKFDQRNQSGQVNQKMRPLWFGQNRQEMFQAGRNCFRAMFAHGLRVLRGLASIGDFDRKPFYLKQLSCLIT